MSAEHDLPATAAPSPRSGPTGSDVLIALALSGGLFIFLAVALGVLHLTASEWLLGPWGLLVQLALANFVLAVGAMAIAARRGWRVYGFARLPLPTLALCMAGGAIGGIALAYLLSLLSSATGLPIHGVNDDLMGMDALPPGGFLLFAMIAAGTTPLTEELIFRGLLFQWLRGWIGPIGGALISAALFGALHWPNGQAVWAGLVGFALALVFHRVGSIWASIAAHAGNNALAILLVTVLSI